MATVVLHKDYVLSLAQKSLITYQKEKEILCKDICDRYIKRHKFLSNFLVWLKPLTYEDFKKIKEDYFTLGELMYYGLYNDNEIYLCNKIIHVCKDNNIINNKITLTAQEYIILKG